MQLATLDEGWVTDQYYANLVADQREYPVPEGAGRIKRVSLLWTRGQTTWEVPLERREYWGEPVAHTAGQGSIDTYRPTYQLQGNLIILEPAPGFAQSNALMIDLELAPNRLTGDADEIDLRFPDVMETLLTYDTAVMALQIEKSQDGARDAVGEIMDDIRGFQRRYENMFIDYCTDRTEGVVRGRPYKLGA